ncbi:methyl viologen resistance protein SmvA [Thermoplasmatales archaeon]|nr:methyl viologen resistance protein SmvA [Thermoplasmatales archaeon]
MTVESENKLIIALLVAVLMGAVDSTIVILALPTITVDLGTTLSLSIWIIMIYLLVIAVGTTQLGRLGDILSRKRIFNAGIALFTLGSALCGASPTILYLILFRGIQASGAAMIQSNSGAIVADNFPPNRRGRVFGYTSVGYNAGAMLGIVFGGLITTFIGWRYIFYINVPIGIFAFIFAVRNIKPGKRVDNKLDIPGTTTLAISLSLISYAVVDITANGVDAFNELLVLSGLILVVIFVLIERVVSRPLLPLKIFRIRILSFSIMASFFQSLGFLAVVFIVIMYLQGIRGLSPLDSSLLLLPGYVVGSVLGPFFGKLTDRIGSRIPATMGLFIMGSAILVYLTITVTSSLYIVLVGSFLTGTGSSMFYPANNSAVMANSPRELYGLSSGFLRTMANIGMLGSFIVAITIASISVPRSVAFAVFAGVLNSLGSVSASFMTGIHSALLVALLILAVAGILSLSRGGENRPGQH